MLQITPQHRLLLAIEPVDFRAGIDALVALCKKQLDQDPFSGTLLFLPIVSALLLKYLCTMAMVFGYVKSASLKAA